eukprot:4864066-Amphidinium_carterae.5
MVFDHERFKKVQHGVSCVCASVSELILADDPHLTIDLTDPEPSSRDVASSVSSPPSEPLTKILRQLEKVDMPRDHGRSKALQTVKYPRSILFGLYTKTIVGIGSHTPHRMEVLHDIHELARHRAALSDYCAITIIKSCEGEHVPPHRDKISLGVSHVIIVIPLGSLTCGQLWAETTHGKVSAPSTDVKRMGKLTLTRHAWAALDPANLMHAVMPVTKGARYSIAIYSPRRLHALHAEDWVRLETLGYPVTTLKQTYISRPDRLDHQSI